MMVRMIRIFSVVGILLFFAACSLPRPPLPYDASNPLKHVAVLPMKNDTADVDGPELVRKKMIAALENRSYLVQDMKKTDQILRDRMGITLGGQLDMTTPQKLGEALGVEGVLYGTLMDFGETTTGVYNVKKVRGIFRLVNTMTGQTMWSRGLGVRSEMQMQSRAGTAATVLAHAADSRDKEAPWVTIEHTTTGSSKLGESFAIGLSTKLISKAFGVHLDHESAELARRVTDNLPWGPGAGAPAAAPVVSAPQMAAPEIKMPEPPSFGYMDWEGKRDFTAVVVSTSFQKGRDEPHTMEFPLAISGNKMRMDMDMSRMMKDADQSPLSRMVVISRGDRKTGYTLYPNCRRYMTNKEAAETGERPKVEKTRLGSEMIGKHRTDKYRVKVIYKEGTVEEGLIWNARDLGGMTIKSEVENKDFKISTELKNIVLKTPPSSLFEIPAGYTEARNFMDLMTQDQKKK